MSYITTQSPEDGVSITIEIDDSPLMVYINGKDTYFSFAADDLLLQLLKEALDTYFVVRAERDKVFRV